MIFIDRDHTRVVLGGGLWLSSMAVTVPWLAVMVLLTISWSLVIYGC